MTVKNAIDKEAIRARYAEEREKRLRPDGNDQYLRLAGTTLAHYIDDPYMPLVERDPVTDHVDVALVGGGFAGLITGARLKEAGVEKVRIIDKTDDLGGNWYWNRYPTKTENSEYGARPATPAGYLGLLGLVVRKARQAWSR